MPEVTRRDSFDRITKFYDSLVDRYGHDPRACDYGRAESQATKFKVLADVMDLKNKRVLDVGCGFADYADYLRDRFGSVTYVGIDISTRMISEARRLRPNLDLRVCNILDDTVNGTFDVVTANGIFYLLGDEAPGLMHQIIRRMYETAQSAVAFNSLSSWAEIKQPGEFHADPAETMEFCRRCTPWVTMRHDYLPHDFAIYMYRDGKRN